MAQQVCLLEAGLTVPCHFLKAAVISCVVKLYLSTLLVCIVILRFFKSIYRAVGQEVFRHEAV